MLIDGAKSLIIRGCHSHECDLALILQFLDGIGDGGFARGSGAGRGGETALLRQHSKNLKLVQAQRFYLILKI